MHGASKAKEVHTNIITVIYFFSSTAEYTEKLRRDAAE